MILKKFRLCLVNYELKINTVPEDATVDFTIGEKQITGTKQTTKYPNQDVSYLVKRSGYMSQSGVWNTNEDKEITVTLEELKKVSGEVINSSLSATNDNVTATLDIKYTYSDGSTVTEQHSQTFSKSYEVLTSWVDNESLPYGGDINEKLVVVSGAKTNSDSITSKTINDWTYDDVSRICQFTDTCASGSVYTNTAKILFPSNITYTDEFVTFNFGTTEPTLTDVQVTNTLIEETSDMKKYTHTNIIRITYANNNQLMNIGGEIDVALLPEMWNITFNYTGSSGTIYVNDNVVQGGVATQVVPNSNVEFYVVTSAGRTGTSNFICTEDNMVVTIVESYMTETSDGTLVPVTPGSGTSQSDLLIVSTIGVTITGSGNSTEYNTGYNTSSYSYGYTVKPNEPITVQVTDNTTHETKTTTANMYTLTFVTDPSDATVLINGSPLDTIMKYMENTKLKYEVSKDGYVSVSELYLVTKDATINVTLQPAYNLTISVLPETADETIMVNGNQVEADTPVVLAQNSTAEYTITAKKFIPQSDTILMDSDKHITITLSDSGPVDALLADDYIYEVDDDNNVILEQYIGSSDYITTPTIEE